MAKRDETEPAEPTDNSTPEGVTGETVSEPAEDENRRRYREALERKRGGGSKAGAGGGSGPGSGSLAATASAKTQRTFRRKSGG